MKPDQDKKQRNIAPINSSKTVDLHKQTAMPSEQEKIDKAIDLLIAGNFKALQYSEVAQALPDKVAALLNEDNIPKLDLLLGQMVAGMQEDDKALSQNAGIALARTLTILAEHERWPRMDRLLPAIEQAIHSVEGNEEVFQQTFTAITRLVASHIRMEQYGLARDALLVINGPATGDSATKRLRKHTAPTIKNLLLRPVVDKLLAKYLQGGEQQNDAGRLLVAFGSQAATFLLDDLTLDQDRTNRHLLLNLIKEIGLPAKHNLLQLLHQESTPWYLIRNIINLLGDTGNPNCYEDVIQYLDYDDVRVQKEVLTAASKIGGNGSKPFLLKALNTVPRQLTSQVVSLLGDIPDNSLVVPLADLLDQISMFQSKTSAELQITTCQALGSIGSVKAVPTLQKIIDNIKISGADKKTLKENELLKTAEDAIQLIQLGGSHKIRKTRVKRVMGVALTSDPVATHEATIFRIARAGDKKKATRQLFKLISACVKNRDFDNAERLRERFAEIDPMAISEIIRSEELIEQEKLGITRPKYLDVWSDLLDELTSEEFSAIYHELENRSLQAEELVVGQGADNDELFFINYGEIKAFYKQDGREVFIKGLLGGEIAGENFFDASLWTISLRALTPSQISILKRSSFNRWQEAFPGLVDKLKAFYDRSNNIHNLLDRKGLNRRIYERYQLSREAAFQMTDAKGNPIGQGFKGKLLNISKGGLALQIRTKQESGRVLLGRKMQITIPTGGKIAQLQVIGLVLAIHQVTGKNECIVHFRFVKPLDQDRLQSVLG